MSPNIRVDSEVYKALQRRATPFVDTPNSVLRRILNLDSDVPPTQEQTQTELDAKPVAGHVKEDRRKTRRVARARTRGSEPRALAGSLLPESEYTAPLLAALVESGGSGPIREIIAAVGKKLDGKLTVADKEKTSSGAIRWQNRLQFVRLRLVEEGLLAKGSPRGIWALTDTGRARLDDVAPATA